MNRIKSNHVIKSLGKWWHLRNDMSDFSSCAKCEFNHDQECNLYANFDCLSSVGGGVFRNGGYWVEIGFK